MSLESRLVRPPWPSEHQIQSMVPSPVCHENIKLAHRKSKTTTTTTPTICHDTPSSFQNQERVQSHVAYIPSDDIGCDGSSVLVYHSVKKND